ncbi:ABC transporter substrate-binding protein [Thioclava sp. GXIMD4215]|uniref:ABC transporter substrate-binding protein n=1 Tax=Thioclava sp. GXIMD4215 TaxID=3131928 RepID=UPI00311B1D52
MFSTLKRALAVSLCLAGLTSPALARSGTDVTFVQAVEPQGLDPTSGSPVAAGQVTWENVFEGLVAIDRNGQIQPQLARSWQISEDGLTYRFALQPDVQFHNGAPFSSASAKFTLDRLLSDQSTNGQKALFSAIETVEAPDPQTLVLHLSHPDSDLLYWLGFPAAVMVDPASAASNATQPVGTGPFKVDEWRKGDRVLMSAWDGYWGTKPALSHVTARFIADPQAQSAALQSGQVDIISEFAAPELFDRFTKDARFTTHVGSGEMEVVAGMNNARKPFDDLRVRQALQMSIDRSMLIEAVKSGYGTPIGTHFSPASPYYEDLTGEYPYDPARARQLLAEAGYPDGFAFTFKVPTRSYAQRSAEILQAFFQQIGVTATIEPSTFPATWIQDVFKDSNYDMTIIGHAEPMDIGIYARSPYYFNYHSEAFSAALSAISQARDEAARAAGYHKAQEILAHDLPALFLYSDPKLGVWKAGLTGVWENGPVPANDMTDVRWTSD